MSCSADLLSPSPKYSHESVCAARIKKNAFLKRHPLFNHYICPLFANILPLMNFDQLLIPTDFIDVFIPLKLQGKSIRKGSGG
ncbi:Uncharacterized protein dnm_086530 [Desulfonema magnum]|uniref:Uncharacterized protein n=1 Tax=Desulfonema magnum TaxID=45655 RepID=A0A975BVH5_9BACT|nr:Uncharacterized protein dnm_086530 [Desulfonema magnum]